MMDEATKTTHTPGLVVRFDGPPSHESGRFIELEIDGRSVGSDVAEWVQEGDHWLLRFKPEYSAAPDMLTALERVKRTLSKAEAHGITLEGDLVGQIAYGAMVKAVDQAIAKAEASS